ncbi:hypothetical protein [Actinoplanes sp. G11-F43]|uniref:hypothetical protein n=1 Tax=Actinoplanes sp. G11-F43 TaxID=3424130 RepID=UPI003D337957
MSNVTRNLATKITLSAVASAAIVGVGVAAVQAVTSPATATSDVRALSTVDMNNPGPNVIVYGTANNPGPDRLS